MSNSRTPTSHASSATTYGVSSASNYGHAKASGTTPKAVGTAAVGSETGTFARGDHVHPFPSVVRSTITLSSGFSGTIYKYKMGRMVILVASGIKYSSTTSFKDCGDTAENVEHNENIIVEAGGGQTKLKVQPSGKLQMYCGDTTARDLQVVFFTTD